MARRGSKKKTTQVTSVGTAKDGRKVTTVTEGRKVSRTIVDSKTGPGGVQDVTTTTESSGEGQRGMSAAEQFITLLFLLGCIGVYLHYRPQLLGFWQKIQNAKTTGKAATSSTPATGKAATGIPAIPGVTRIPAIVGAVALPVSK